MKSRLFLYDCVAPDEKSVRAGDMIWRGENVTDDKK